MNDNILTRIEIARAVADKTELSSNQVEAVLKEFEAAIAAQLKQKGEVRLPGFGTFKTSERAERQGRNPKTGEPLQIAARTAVSFVPGKTLKELGR